MKQEDPLTLLYDASIIYLSFVAGVFATYLILELIDAIYKPKPKVISL